MNKISQKPYNYAKCIKFDNLLATNSKIGYTIYGVIMIEINNLHHKYYGTSQDLVIDSFSMQEQERVCVFAPSGGGKTEFLKVLAGLEAYEGEYSYYNEDFKGIKKKNRDIVLTLNDKPFFESKTVFDNLYYVEKIRKVKRRDCKAKINEILKEYHLIGSMYHEVKLLSEERKVRLGLARATMRENPRLVLLDNPFKNLPLNIRNELFNEFMEEHLKYFKSPLIFATDSIEETKRFNTRTIIMDKGRIIYDGDIVDVLEKPQTIRLIELAASNCYNIFDKDFAKKLGYEGDKAAVAVATTDIVIDSNGSTVDVVESYINGNIIMTIVELDSIRIKLITKEIIKEKTVNIVLLWDKCIEFDENYYLDTKV